VAEEGEGGGQAISVRAGRRRLEVEWELLAMLVLIVIRIDDLYEMCSSAWWITKCMGDIGNRSLFSFSLSCQHADLPTKRQTVKNKTNKKGSSTWKSFGASISVDRVQWPQTQIQHGKTVVDLGFFSEQNPSGSSWSLMIPPKLEIVHQLPPNHQK